jgi:cobalt-zinc-cadmium efflux system outer membrane protein
MTMPWKASCLLPLLPLCAIAAPPGAEARSADQLARAAVERSRELQALREKVGEARGLLRLAGLRPAPNLQASGTTGRPFGAPGKEEYTAGVSQPLETGGKRQKRMRVAEIAVALAESEIADGALRLAAEVKLRYADAIAERARTRALERALAAGRESLRLIEARVELGDAAPLDRQLLAVEVSRLEAQRRAAAGRAEAALSDLRRLCSLAPGEPLALAAPIAGPVVSHTLAAPIAAPNAGHAPAAPDATPVTGHAPAAPDATPVTGHAPAAPDATPVTGNTLAAPIAAPVTGHALAALQQRALETRPDLRVARLEEERGAAGVSLADAEGRADLTLSAQYALRNDRFGDLYGLTASGQPAPMRDRDSSIAFGVSIPLLTRRRNAGAMQAAAARSAAAKLSRRHLEAAIPLEVEAAWRRWEAAAATAQILDRDVLRQAEKNLEVMRQAYGLGQLRLLDVLAEQRRVIEAEMSLIDAESEARRGWIELERFVGGDLQ